LYSLSGQKIKTLVSGYAKEASEKIALLPDVGDGYYIVGIHYHGGEVARKIAVMK
jgi:hypothetical protein